MPVSSLQINQMMAGQQAMFGNAATYAQQISPMGQAMGMAPSYANPYGPMASPGAAEFNQGSAAAPGILNAAASYGAPVMMGAGMMMGGRAGAMLDPFTAGIRGFGRGVGWQGGAGITSNLGAIARGGIGGIARGAMMGAAYAAPVMALYAAGKYAFGQMSEGAQFQNQTNAMLQNTFRFTNEQSRTGYGFSQLEQRQIGSMLHDMGTKDIMSTPQEMLSLVGRGAQMGVFRGVQDAREFKTRFTQMKESLKEIAQTFNTTLSEAVPFFQQARQQGFWTPQDITRHASQVRQVQANTGMSAAQAQNVMGMGAQMVRSIGGTGQQGSEMMARAQMMSGAALFGGVVNERQLANAGFGTGAEGAQNLGMMLAGASARFARSRVGRWALASMMNKEGTGLDPEGIQYLASGSMSIGEMGSRARRNVSGRRAYNFVMNEEEMRGQLAQAGPQATLGIVRSLVGGRLYGEGGRDKLITRRIIQRFMGGNARQAELVAKMAREMPRMMAIEAARSEGSLDAQAQHAERQMQDTYEGFKRQAGQWWREKITGPLQAVGADFSYRVGQTWQRFQDRLFGTTGRGVSLSADAVRGMVRSAMTGNMEYVDQAMGSSNMMARDLGGNVFSGRTLGFGGSRQMMRLGFVPQGIGQAEGGWLARAFTPVGMRFGTAQLREMQALSRASRGVTGEEEASAIGYGGAGEMREAMRGAGAQQIQEYLRSGEVLALRGRSGGIGGTYGEMDAAERQEYAQNLLTRIRAGRAGEQARQMFAGLGGRQAIGRLMAMQGAARGGRTGMGDIGGELGLRQGQSLREAVEDFSAQSTQDLATALRGGARDAWWDPRTLLAAQSGGLVGVPVTEQSIEEIKKDSRGERAMKLFARARTLRAEGGDADKAASAEQEARRLMGEVANDKSVPKEVASAATLLANGSHPQAKAFAEAAGKAGASLNYKDQVAFGEKITMRRRRLREGMGEAMTALEAAGGGDKGGLTQAFQAAMQETGTGPGGLVSGKDYVNRMQRLAEAAAADPDKANRMLAIMRREGQGATDIGVALESAIRVSGEAKRFGLKEDIGETGAITDRARRGISRRLQQLGVTGVKGKGLEDIIRGGGAGVTKVKEQLLGQGYTEDDVKEFLQTMKGGMTVEEMRAAGVKGAGAMGIRTLSDKVASRAGLDPKELAGKIGERDNPTVTELKVHTVWFQKLHDALGSISRNEKMPEKSQKGTK